MKSEILSRVLRVYEGSDGEATRKLYGQLEQLGAVGVIAVNLFRAQKCSARAKVYRGGVPGKGSYRTMAYERKQWSLDNLAKTLTEHAQACGITWGWGEDPQQEFHRYVLFVELPNGQVSFHTGQRGIGPDAPNPWDGVRGASPQRVCTFVARVLDGTARPAPISSIGEQPCPQI